MTDQDDIAQEELQAIQQQAKKWLAKNGPITDEQLQAMVDEMNETAPAQ